jgi:hypothetical protein
MSDLLRSLGIPILEPYAESNLSPAPDLVVIGNALSRGNPEIERVLDERIPFTSMAALLREEFLTGRESLVVAGTHGKTTTTSMLAWIYQVAARKIPRSSLRSSSAASRKTSAPASSSAPRAPSSLKATSTTPPSSTRAPSSSTTFPTRSSSPTSSSTTPTSTPTSKPSRPPSSVSSILSRAAASSSPTTAAPT